MCYSLANFWASYFETCLYYLRSDLLPIRTLTAQLLLYFYIQKSHDFMSSKLFLLDKSKTKIIPWQPLQQEDVMFLNFYCPAVSHICNLTILPDSWIVLILKSTPMVGRKASWKTLSANLINRLDFPTEELPISNILKEKSISLEQWSQYMMQLFVYNYKIWFIHYHAKYQQQQDIFSYLYKRINTPYTENTYYVICQLGLVMAKS